MRSSKKLLALFLTATSLVGLTACGDDDPIGPNVFAREIGVVVTSTDVTLTFFDVEDPSQSEAVGLGADGSPVTVALRGRYAAVPMGTAPAVAVVDLRDGVLARTVGLPEGSGASGVAFINDSIALVANSNLNTVTPVNVWAGTAGEQVEVGRFPQGIIVHDGKAYVINGELESFSPDGASTLTVIDVSTLDVLDTIELSGQNASAGVAGPDGLLYVIQSGWYGVDDGVLSVVDPGSGTEVGAHEGFGSPGSIAIDDDGTVYVGAFGVGVLVWESGSETFVHGPENPVTPGGVASTSGIGIDSDGRIYTLTPDCQDPAVAHRLDNNLESEEEIPVGICPFAIGFTEVEGDG